MRTLTRQEAAERAGLIAVEAYDVELDFTMGATTFRSTTRLRFDCRQPGSTTFVELLASGRPSIRLNGHSLDDGAYDGERISLRDLDATNELVVEADCGYTDTGEGMHRFVDPEDGETYLYSNAFLYEAQRIFACFDQPDLKATFALRVIGPVGWKVLANGAGSETTRGHWTFEPTPRLSTYLIAICAGPFESFGAVRDGIPLGVHCRRSMARYVEVDDMLGDAQAALAFYRDLFGRPYPFSKCDLVFVPETNGAMENAACITFSDDDYIFRSPVTDVRRRERTDVIAHELAHMWFGDLVTMRWWDDLWLNESFASYLAALTLAEATRHRTAWTAFILGDKAWGYWADQLPTTHPISADVPDAIATMLNLDGISYSKGAGALKQLVAWVGFEPFKHGLRAYIAEHAWSNTTIDDLMAALEAASGRDLRRWTHEWLQTAGLATLVPVVSADGDGHLTGLAIEQSAPADQPTLRSHRVAIGLYDRIDGRTVRRDRIEIDIVGARTPVAADGVGLVPDLLVVNDDDLTWAKTRLDDRSLAAVLDGAIDGVEAPITRAVLWTALREMTVDAVVPVADYLQAVMAAMGREPDITILDDLQRRALTAINRLGDQTLRDERLRDLAGRSLDRLSVAEPASDHQLAHARTVIRSAVDAGHVAILRGWLADRGIPDRLVIGPDLRWEIVARLAVLGRIEPGDINREFEADPTSAGAEAAARARSSLPTNTAKAAAWTGVLGSDPPSVGILVATVAGFWQPEQVELCRPYLDRYVPEVAERWRDSQQVARILARGLFPSVLVEPSALELVRQAAGDMTLDPSFRRILAEGASDMERTLKTRALDA
jgi:aminopeptidase N